MMKIYNFLFYIFFCLVIKKPNDQSHTRALMLQGIMLLNYFTDFLFSIILIFNVDLVFIKFILLLMIVIYIIVNKMENKYYIDSGKYKEAIEKYNLIYSKLQRKLLAIFALILIIFSMVLFIWIGVKIGMKHL